LLHGLPRSGDAPGESGSIRCLGRGFRRKRRPVIRPSHWFGRMRSGGGSASAAAASSPAPRCQRAGSVASIELSGSRFHRGCSNVEHRPRRQELIIVATMIAVRATLTNSAAIPIFDGGMTRCPHVRPDDLPILERTGQPLPTSLFRRPPARVPRGPAPRCRAAFRSSGLDDQAHVDRCHTRGRNPRGGAGW
jgi:hypothetical protein